MLASTTATDGPGYLRPLVVAPGRVRQWQWLSVELAGRDSILEGLAPGLQLKAVERAVSHLAREWQRRSTGKPGRRDRYVGEQLQHPLRCPDQAARVAAQVDDQACLGAAAQAAGSPR